MVFRLTDPDMNVEGELKGARFTIATTNTSWIFSPSFRSADYRYAYNEAGITAVLHRICHPMIISSMPTSPTSGINSPPR